MNHKNVFVLVTGLLLVSSVIAACSPAVTTIPPTVALSATVQPTEGPAQPVANFPTGKFVELDNQEAGFEFNTDGTWRSFNGIYTIGRGTYSANGDLYTEETNSENCGTSPMSFKYSFDGTNLKFELTEESMNDDCDGRKSAFDGKTYLLSQ